jgi:hypothetical protein
MRKYSESVKSVTWHGSLRLVRAEMGACSSMRLLVVAGQTPIKECTTRYTSQSRFADDYFPGWSSSAHPCKVIP